jgi:hypothetical protein
MPSFADALNRIGFFLSWGQMKLGSEEKFF